MKTKSVLFFFTLLLSASFNSIAQNVYFCSEAFSAGVKPTNQLLFKAKDEGGKIGLWSYNDTCKKLEQITSEQNSKI
jgi:hypothetical protein